jgi:hypothetical protein
MKNIAKTAQRLKEMHVEISREINRLLQQMRVIQETQAHLIFDVLREKLNLHKMARSCAYDTWVQHETKHKTVE